MVDIRDRIDVLIRILFGAFIAIGCYWVVSPFLTAITLAGIVTIVSWPLFERFRTALGNRPTWASIVMVTLLTVCVIIPISFLSAVVAHQLPGAVSGVMNAMQNMSAPIWLQDIPYIGPWLYGQLAFLFDIKELNELIQRLVQPMSRFALNTAISAGNGLLQMVLVAFIAFFIYRDGELLAQRAKALLERAAGGLGEELSQILVNTTRSVVWGIVGTAAGQGIVAGIGFLIAGVPGALLLSVAVFVLSVVPIGPPLVWGPVAFWLYSKGDFAMAAFMVAWGVLAVAMVDNFLKPILIARGTPLPISLVFLGVFGGVFAFGVMGLILGPVFIAIGVAMFKTWISGRTKRKKGPPASVHLVAPKPDKEVQVAAPPSQTTVSGSEQKKTNATPRRSHPRSYPKKSRR